MLHLIFGWALIVLGIALVVLAVRTWFNGSIYDPGGNFIACLGGAVLAVAGVLICLFGLAGLGWLLIALGILTGFWAWACEGIDGRPSSWSWPMTICAVVAVAGVVLVL